MKQKLTPLAMSLCLLGLASAPAFADTQPVASQSLENQVKELQREVAALKGQKTTHHVYHHHVTKASKNSSTSTSNNARIANIEAQQAQATANQPQISGPQHLPQEGIQYLPVDLDVPGQSFVSTGPYIGVPLQYSGSDLIVNNPSVNQDVALLNLRRNIDQRLIGLGLNASDFHSHLLLSGMVEGQANYKSAGGSTNSSDIDLTAANLDAYILGPSTWTSGLISLSYDNNIGAQTGSFSNNSRSQNSRVFVNQAFVILGDFAQSPFYGTLGQMYVPFGSYGTSQVSSPMIKLIFRTQARALLAGYQGPGKNSFYGAIYAFKGDSYTGSSSRVNNGGINAGYRYAIGDCFSGNFGAGAIANIADSQGMQNTGNGAVYVPPAINVPASTAVFGGFGGVAGTGNEKIIHRVPAYDVRGLFSIYKSVDIIVEYLTASTSFNAADMTFKSHTAKPQALNAEIAYSFQSLAKPTSVTLGYGMTKEALALGMPAQRYTLTLNHSEWRNTLQALEFRHDINYATSATSSGSGIPGPTFSGSSDNVVTAQFDLFF